MARVKFRDDDGIDRAQEYLDLRESNGTEAAEVRAAIETVLADPETAARRYSVKPDPQVSVYCMPYLRLGLLTVLAWRELEPDGDDVNQVRIEVIDFGQVWGDDLEMPRVYPRPSQ